MKTMTAYAMTWISCGIAVSVGIFITKDASCLWAFLIPAFISVESK